MVSPAPARLALHRMAAWAILLTALFPVRATDDVTLACAKAAQRTQEINLSSGIYTQAAVASAPLAISIPVGSDPERYQDCLQREGKANDRNAAIYAERARNCRQHTTDRRAEVKDTNGAVRLTASRSADAVTRCLAGEMEVEASFPDK